MYAQRNSLLGSSARSIKTHNLRAILLILLWNAPISRARIAELTGFSTTTATNLIGELLEEGIVAESGVEQLDSPRGVGRPRVALQLVPEARYAIGVHIGVGQVRVAIANLFGQSVTTLSLEHPLDLDADDVLDEIVVMVREVIAQSGIEPGIIVGVGVGASGLVDLATGVNVFAPNLGWRNIPIREQLSAALDLPVFVDNNVRAMALAESMFGVGPEVSTLAFVYTRVGVGAGFTLDGQIFRTGAGELGHMTIQSDGGARCRCGDRGCLETLVSEPVIQQLAFDLADQNPDGVLATHLQNEQLPVIERIFAAARAGDAATQAMLRERARYMGIGLANLVNTISPKLIILGGIFAQGEDILFPMVESAIREAAFANLGASVQLRTPTFGHDAGVIGAAALALHSFFYEVFA
jgi:predicted NBD/HSP70 family sugar kinase